MLLEPLRPRAVVFDILRAVVNLYDHGQNIAGRRTRAGPPS